MKTFKKILLTTDLSGNSEAAFPYAAELAKRFQGEIYLIHVFVESMYFPPTGLDITPPPDWNEWVLESLKADEEKLKTLTASLQKTTEVPIHSMLLDGNTSREIIKFATEKEMDCIVIATHGRSGLSHMLFGSVAENVFRQAPCPVMTVRPASIKEHEPETVQA